MQELHLQFTHKRLSCITMSSRIMNQTTFKEQGVGKTFGAEALHLRAGVWEGLVSHFHTAYATLLNLQSCNSWESSATNKPAWLHTLSCQHAMRSKPLLIRSKHNTAELYTQRTKTDAKKEQSTGEIDENRYQNYAFSGCSGLTFTKTPKDLVRFSHI